MITAMQVCDDVRFLQEKISKEFEGCEPDFMIRQAIYPFLISLSVTNANEYKEALEYAFRGY